MRFLRRDLSWVQTGRGAPEGVSLPGPTLRPTSGQLGFKIIFYSFKECTKPVRLKIFALTWAIKPEL
jgi:hypothetical protein